MAQSDPICNALFESVLILVQEINNQELSDLNYWLRHIVNSLFESL